VKREAVAAHGVGRGVGAVCGASGGVGAARGCSIRKRVKCIYI
jgi:hypothetical protein